MMRDADARVEKPSPALREAQAARLHRTWESPSGWRYWSDVQNTEVGTWYTCATFLFFFFGGVLALIMRLQLAVPENDLVSADRYNQMFTLHGSIMMFLFAVPVFEAASILFMPQMLSARDMPFPRLSAYGFWCFAIGGVFVCGSIFFNAAPAGGWFMYPPLTTTYQPGVGPDIWLLGLSFIEVASIAAAVELLVGILKCRPPGMRINLIPLYCWYVLVVAVMILFAFPPLIVGDLLLELERTLGWPFFDARRGGDPLLWQHLFWIFGHPEVYIVFLPSIALVAMIVPTFARRPMIGYSWIVLAAVGTGFLSFGLWVHHMFTTGLPGVSLALFSAASTAVALPTAVQIFCILATIAAGRLARSVPMLFIFGGLASFVIGGLTGVMVAIVPFNFQAHDTHFVPVLAALHYYFPLVTGKLMDDRVGRAAFWLTFIGFNVTFMPLHLAGLRGMVRRIYTYPAALGFDTLNLVSTIGAFLLGAGLVVFLWNVVRSVRSGERTEMDPWKAGTLEWLEPLPTAPWGIRSIPRVSVRYPLWDQPGIVKDTLEGRGYLPDAEEGKRETLVTSVVDAVPQQVLRVQGPSFLPMLASVGTGGVFIFSTFHWWAAAAISGGVALVMILSWLWRGTAIIPEKPDKHAGHGALLPIYVSGRASVGWWAMFITMLGDMAAFISLLFAYFFYWTVRPDFIPRAPDPGTWWLTVGLALAVLAWMLTAASRHLNRADRSIAFFVSVLIGALAAAASIPALISGPLSAKLDPTAHVYEATVWTLVLWSAVHIAVGIVMQLYVAARRLAGRMDARHDIDISNVTLYWHFTGVTIVATIAVLVGFPWLL
jgi:cytochrome c oxidase subunit I+III